ncbi:MULTISPECIES: mechanosensitive ion channel domain-containing protein [unclassified Pseudoalteromonas]|uniref:mechanosensitive ion channel family protein n=1 Tax=unclassified Pseudoalteromonas TaxID=194690 RepID=UPI000C08061B|nr:MULTISPECIES: mechanosensitive ion channel domain-containing protein [unclassified Pseudoalteromonas]MDP2636068.1 mechanosensitive ion channel [Pseudoalteromonas sp. 1_MG-2023]PHN90613.1 mechanosensitive ion channel protein [Pseudoalteromonas sp. 3D05]
MLKIPTISEAEKLIEEKLGGWVDIVISHIPNFIVAVIIAILFSILARFLGSMIRNILRRSLDSNQIADLMASIFKMIILCVGLFVALDFVGLKGTVTSLLAGAGIVGLAIGFAFQDMTENLIAGIAMGIRKPFKTGDVIKTDDVFGTVKAINLRNTLVENFYGQLNLVPNKILFRNVLRNYSTLGVRRIEVPVGISYGDDPEHAAEVIVKKINEFDFVIKQDETAVYASGFGDSSVNLLVWFWINYPGEADFMTVRHKAIVAVKQALAEADISIPFPIRTLDFGIKGGEKLDAMISDKQNDD